MRDRLDRRRDNPFPPDADAGHADRARVVDRKAMTMSHRLEM
jgi:hypothetical protein